MIEREITFVLNDIEPLKQKHICIYDEYMSMFKQKNHGKPLNIHKYENKLIYIT
jgi:hypothetical protein